ncbi:MAG TPA: efflux RND transporter periplasmic adaptor subunit [Thiothrix sp.]|nr:efflux RND transporter periplasmic adaptor subunit [Thiothrix sp.]
MNQPLKSLLIFLSLLSYSLFIYAEAPKSTLIKIENSQRDALGITSKPVDLVDTAWGASYPAKVIVPNSQLRVVSAPLSGLLESLHVAEGETVEKGQTLAVIHSPQLLEQQSRYLEALTALGLASTEKKRDEQLSKEGIIAKRRFLESSAKYTQAKTQVEQYKQSLKLSGMSQSALASLKHTHKLSATLTIKAPLDGVVLEQLATPGSQLNALDPIYKVGHLTPLWLEIHVPLDELGDAKQGVIVKTAKPKVVGKVITVGRMVHGTDQGVLIRAEVSDGAEKLRPGQFIQAQIAHTNSHNTKTFSIPRSALIRNEGMKWVLLEKPTGFLPVAVEIIKEGTTDLVISGKLSSGNAIVTSGTAALKAIWLEGTE